MKKTVQFKKQVKYACMVIFLGLGTQMSGQAQEAEFGIKAGGIYNMPSYGNKAVSKADSKFGAQVGIFARTTGKIYGEGELAFAHYKSSYTLQDKAYDPKFYQVSLPLQVGYKLIENDKITFRGSLGPQLNYIKTKGATGGNDFQKFTYDGMINVGADVKHFTIDLRYNHSLNKTNKNLDSRNRMLGLSVGYKF